MDIAKLFENLNTKIERLIDRVARLEKNAATSVQMAWLTPTFTNGWTQFNSATNPVRYFRDSLGMVHLKGYISGGAVGSPAFTLPVGYRPDTQYNVLVRTGGGASTALQVEVNGQVTVNTPYTTWVSLDNVHFRAV